MIKRKLSPACVALVIGLFAMAQTPPLPAQSNEDAFLQSDEELDQDDSADVDDDPEADVLDEAAEEEEDAQDDAQDDAQYDSADVEELDDSVGSGEDDQESIREPTPAATPAPRPVTPADRPSPQATPARPQGSAQCPTEKTVVRGAQAITLESSCKYKCRPTNEHGLFYCDPP